MYAQQAIHYTYNMEAQQLKIGKRSLVALQLVREREEIMAVKRRGRRLDASY